MVRPDFSRFVAHFTKSSLPCVTDGIDGDSPPAEITGTAYDKLVNILRSRKILATPMPWTKRRAVALTECPWWSLIDHAKRYSPYGLGFTKDHVFAAGGGPAIYLRPDLHEKQSEFVHEKQPAWKGFHSHLYAFVTPFVPPYAPAAFLDDHWHGKNPVDYSHEREWRVPHEFSFELGQVQFVVVKSYKDMAEFPKDLKDGIGRDRFVIMDVYHQIEKLWPTHLLGEEDL